MSNPSSKGTLFAVVGAQRIECGLLRGSGRGAAWVKDSLLELPIDVALSDRPLQALRAALEHLQSQLQLALSTARADATWKIRELRVVVADSWLAVAGVPWSSDLRQDAAAHAFARGQLISAGFELDPASSVKIDDAPYGEPRLVVAYPTVLLGALGQLARSLDTRLTMLLPLSVAAWNWAHAQNRAKLQALAVLDEGLSLISSGGAYLSSVVVRAGAAGLPATQALQEHWRRACLRDPYLTRVARLPVLNLTQSDGPAPDLGQELIRMELPRQPGALAPSPGLQLATLLKPNASALNAMPSQPATTPWRWSIAGLIWLVAGAVAVQAWQTIASVRSLSVGLKAAQDTALPAPAAGPWSREEIARVRAVNSAIRELNLPISALLRSLQPPRDIRVELLSVEVVPANAAASDHSTGIKIMAEARTGVEMTRYAAFVAEHKLLYRAYLTRHEIVESVPEQPYRFTMEAQWQE